MILSLLTGMIKHSQSTLSKKFAIALNISMRKLGMMFIFYMQIKTNLYTSSVGIAVFEGSDQACPKHPK